MPRADGYLNESGVINTKRLQVILDEMAEWEREVFEKEYADLNWYKGKQAKHVKEMEMGRKRSKFGTHRTVLCYSLLIRALMACAHSVDGIAEEDL